LENNHNETRDKYTEDQVGLMAEQKAKGRLTACYILYSAQLLLSNTNKDFEMRGFEIEKYKT